MEKLKFDSLIKKDISKLEKDLNSYYKSIIDVIKANKDLEFLDGYFSYGLDDNDSSSSITTIYPDILVTDQYGNSSKELKFKDLDLSLKIKIIERLIEEYNLFIS